MSHSSDDDIVYNTLEKCSESVDVLPKTKHLQEVGLSKKFTTLSINRKIKSQPTLDTQSSRSAMKIDVLKNVLIADPDFIEFRNFEPNTLNKKIITLLNIDTTPVKFQLEARPAKSKFIVMFLDKERNILSPGMQVKLIVFFQSEAFEEPSELLVVNVQNGRPIVIKLSAYRDPPILRVTRKTYRESSSSSSSLDFNTLPNDDWDIIINDTIRESSEQSYSISSCETDDTGSSSSSMSLNGNIFDGGKCFVGELVAWSVTYENVGGKGRFFVASEMDWCLTHIEDVTCENIIILDTFALWPAYFILEPGERISLNVYFCPDSCGLHVDKLHLICDNCSVKAAEIIGDGVMYEANFLKFDKHVKKRWPSDITFDGPADYYIHLGRSPGNRILEAITSVTNTSGLSIHFRWETRYNEDEANCLNVDIRPSSGYFPPSNIVHFSVKASIPDLPPGSYFATCQLYLEDIPLTAIPRQYQFLAEESQAKRRCCLASADIRAADVEVWVECAPKESSPPNDIPSSSSETLQQVIGVIPEKSSITLDDVTDQDELDNDSYGHKLTPSLTTLELFSSLETVDVRTKGSLFKGSSKVAGVLRPNRPLFVGIEEKYTLILRNVSHRSVTYNWGHPLDSDMAKIRLRICPISGVISPRSVEEIQITLIPLDTGIIRSLQVPCYVEDTYVVILEIECEIKSFYVSLHVPEVDGSGPGFHVNFARFEWHADSLENIVHDFPGKELGSVPLEKILEEKELMTVDLDEGSPLNDASIMTSQHETQNGELQESREDQIGIWGTKDSDESFMDGEGQGRFTQLFSGDIVLSKTPIRSRLLQKAVIEFADLPLMTAMHKKFVITNETPVSSHVYIDIQNFFPRNKRYKKSKETAIHEIYKCALDIETDEWGEMKQVTSGLLIYIEPSDASLAPYESLAFGVYAFADTWGIYTDHLQISIVGLPRYSLEIRVRVNESPISFPICEGTNTRVPIFRLGTIASGSVTRKVIIRNTSVLPLIVNWHKFLFEPSFDDNVSPFNVILDIHAPFTNELATLLTETKEKGEIEELLGRQLERYESRNMLDDLNNFDAGSLANSDAGKTEYSAPEEEKETGFSSSSDVTEDYKTSGHFDSHYSRPKVASYIFHQRRFDLMKDTKINVEIVPSYYGRTDKNFCIIRPEETFLPPKGKTSIDITISSTKYPFTGSGDKITCKVLGFVRIAPMHKYKDHHYLRKDGFFLSPVEFRIETRFVKPQLVYNISKRERIFSLNAEYALQAKTVVKKRRTYIFHNKEEAEIYVHFDVTEPFQIERIIPCGMAGLTYNNGNIYVKGHENIQEMISCSINRTFIENILKVGKHPTPGNTTVTTKGFLLIKHADKSTQVIELVLKIEFSLNDLRWVDSLNCA